MINTIGKSSIINLNGTGLARPVFIFAGQSNVDGYLFVASDLESQYKQTYDDVQFYKYSLLNGVAFSGLDYNSNPTYQASTQNARYALQFYLYPQLSTLLNKKSYFVHHAVGGTSLNVDWLSTTVGGLYSTLVFKTKATINTITGLDGLAPSLKFFYWGQGEADAANLTAANNYQTNLTNFINNFRTAIGVSVPILIGRINSNIDVGTYPYWNTVRTAQTNVAGSLTGVYLVNQDNATMAADNTHYTNAGYQQISTNVIAVAQANGLI